MFVTTRNEKTEAQIAEIVGLDRSVISRIITNVQMHNGNTGKKKADKRRKLTKKDRIAISRLLLGGEGQKEVAEGFGVSQAEISKVSGTRSGSRAARIGARRRRAGGKKHT